MVKTKEVELKKHIGAIHAGNKLTLLQRKITNALLYNAYDNLLIKEEHQIHIATLCKIIGYDSNDYKTIKKTLVELITTVIQWNLVDGNKFDQEGIWNASSIIACASIDGPLCTYSYSTTMRKLLYHPEFYGRIDMRVQSQFQSTYGLALYENCIRFQNIEQTPWFDLATFRKLMGVEDNKYKTFRDLKNRVINKAVEEVNKYSSVTLIPQLRKENRQVMAIQFLIKKSIPILSNETLIPSFNLEDTLKNKFGLSKKQILQVLTDYDSHYIQQKIQLIESSPSFIQGKIGNLAKYLLSAIKENYQVIKKSSPKQIVDRYENENLKRKEREQLEKQKEKNNQQIMVAFKTLSEEKQKALLNQFEIFIGKSVYAELYSRESLKNILIQDQLCYFLKNKQFLPECAI